jgi:hypothetical protein
MPPLSTYLADKLIRLEARGEPYSFPATLYFALSTTMPNPDGSNVAEPSGGGYTRLAVARNTTNWSAGSDGTVANAIELVWPTATADWNTIVAIAIYDASGGGNMLRYFAIPNRTILSGGLFRILVGLGSLAYRDAA